MALTIGRRTRLLQQLVKAVYVTSFALAMLSTLVACGVSTPMCDEAAGLAAGALDRVTAAYAQAAHDGEGSCASAGLDAAGKRYTDSYAAVALGREAEGAGKAADAIAAYQSAIALDDANPAAREALARLGRPAPQLLPAPPQPSREVPGEPDTSLIVFVSAAATAVACAVLALVVWALWWGRGRMRRQRAAAAEADRSTQLRQARQQMDTAIDRFIAARTDADVRQDQAAELMLDKLDKIRAEVDQKMLALGAAAAARSDELHLLVEDLSECLGEWMGEPHPARERFEAATARDRRGEEPK